MTYNINDTITDIPSLLREVSSASEPFAAGLIMFIWLSISLTGYFSQDRRTGRGNMAMWLTIGGFFSVMISFVLMLMDGLVNLYVVTTTLVLFIVCAAWFIFSGDK